MSRGQRDSKWTPEQDDMLRAQVAAGNSFALVASAINEAFGTSYTRNSAIGRAHRLGLCNAKFIAKRKPKQSRAVKRQITRIVHANGNSDKMRFIECPETDLPALRCVEVRPLAVSFEDLDGCRYPEGDGPFTFCNHPQLEGKSYCGPHYALTVTRKRTISESITEARRTRMRRMNFQKSLLEAAE